MFEHYHNKSHYLTDSDFSGELLHQINNTLKYIVAKQLRVLDVSYNELYRLPGSLHELIMLRELNAAHNKLIYVPSELGKLTELRDVDLNSNCLLGLPMALFESEAIFSLQSLDVSNNQLSELPLSLGNVKSLKTLKISSNKLKYIPAPCKLLTKLTTLHYGNNEWYPFQHGVQLGGKAYGVKALLVVEYLSL